MPRQRPTRIGGRVLALLSVPLNGLIVCELAEGPRSLGELRRALGNPGESTLRGHLVGLEKLGAVRREAVRTTGSSVIQNELTDRGKDRLTATLALRTWLERSPRGSIPLGSLRAKGAAKALSDAWNSALIRALATTPLTLTQLDKLIGALSYPALERRLSAMLVTGLVEKIENRDGRPYAVTLWTREGVGFIVAAARFERLHLEDTLPPSAIDIEAAFLLATPIAALPRDADGVCDLAAETPKGGRRAGVQVAVDRGRIVSCVARLSERPRNWALGAAVAWLEALVHDRTEDLRIGGDRYLVGSLVRGIHRRLFAE